MSDGTLIYLASPYSHDDPDVVQARYDAVCRAAAEFMRRGHHIYSPIAHTHAIAQAGQLPTDFGFWRKYDEAMIARCSEVWVLKLAGWGTSRGVHHEIGIARALGRRVRYVLPPEEARE